MFDTCTYADLQALFTLTFEQIRGLAARHAQLLTTADASTDRDHARGLIRSAAIALAAITERQELLHAINLEFARRNAETEQHQMGHADDD